MCGPMSSGAKGVMGAAGGVAGSVIGLLSGGGGPSGAQKGIANQEATFGQTLENDFASRFADQSQTLASLGGILQNVSEGRFSPGFSAQTLAALNTGAINTTGANYANAARAMGGRLAGRGGDSGLISGVDKQIQAGLASQAAGTLSGQQQQIQLANQAAARENTATAIGGYGSLAQMQAPQQYGSLAGSEMKTAYDTASDINQQEQQSKADFGGGISSLISSGMQLAGAVSDIRLKQNVHLLRILDNGIRLYMYNYIGDNHIFSGVLAQDLLQSPKFNKAVSLGSDGYYRVNYTQLGLPSFDSKEMREAGEKAAQLVMQGAS